MVIDEANIKKENIRLKIVWGKDLREITSIQQTQNDIGQSMHV